MIDHQRLKFVQQRPAPPSALYFGPHLCNCVLRQHGFPVRPVGSQRIVNIGDLQDPCSQRDLIAQEPQRSRRVERYTVGEIKITYFHMA